MNTFQDPVTGRAFREDGRPALTCPDCGNHYAYADALAAHACEGER